MTLDSDSSGLDWPLSSFVWDFVAFNFDPFTLSPPLPITLSAAFDQTHAALAYPAVTLNSHLRIDPLFPMTSDLSGSSLQPSGRPPPPPGPYLHPSDAPDGLLAAQDIYGITYFVVSTEDPRQNYFVIMFPSSLELAGFILLQSILKWPLSHLMAFKFLFFFPRVASYKCRGNFLCLSLSPSLSVTLWTRCPHSIAWFWYIVSW